MEQNKKKPAKILLEPGYQGAPISLFPGSRIKTDDALSSFTFETEKETELFGCKLTGLFRKEDAESSFKDISMILDSSIGVPVYPFGKEPKKGSAFYIIADALPKSLSWHVFFAESSGEKKRSRLLRRDRQIFSKIRWECYVRGKDGEPYFSRMKASDFTSGLLSSGEIKLRLPKDPPCIFNEAPMPGFCIRAVLEEVRYDYPPKLTGFCGFLLEACAKETRVLCRSFHHENGIFVPSFFHPENAGTCAVFVKEDKGIFYRRYFPLPDSGYIGRYFRTENAGSGDTAILFPKESTGFGPKKQKNAIRILAYETEEDSRSLGKIYGFDHQKILLPYKKILPKNFFVIVKKEHPDNGDLFFFARPGFSAPGIFSYRLFEEEGFLVIDDPGSFIGGELFFGGLEIRKDLPENKKIAKDTLFSLMDPKCLPGSPDVLFRSVCAPIPGGSEDFPKEALAPPPGAEDPAFYADLAKKTPGIAPVQAKGVSLPEENAVCIYLRFPKDISSAARSAYMEEIREFLEARRRVSLKILLKEEL